MLLTGAKYRQPTIPPLPNLFKQVGAAGREAISVDAGTIKPPLPAPKPKHIVGTSVALPFEEAVFRL